MTSLTLREHVAEPSNLWIRHSFSAWPEGGSDSFCCDLVTGGLRPSVGGSPLADRDVARLLGSATDVVYVPPIPAEHEASHARIVEVAAGVGAPILIQVVADRLWGTPSDGRHRTQRSTAAGLPPNAVVVIDVLDGLVRLAATLREEFTGSRQSSLPFELDPLQDATVVWPLVAGWTDQPGVLEPALAWFAAAGSRRVVPRVMELHAHERRRLAERLETWPEAFNALFHGDESPPDPVTFRTAAEAAGLEHRLPRPLPAPPLPPRLRLARELAGHLIELGDAAVTGGDAYYRAARFLDPDEIDIEAAAREGNLGVLPWLEPPARHAVEQWLTARRAD